MWRALLARPCVRIKAALRLPQHFSPPLPPMSTTLADELRALVMLDPAPGDPDEAETLAEMIVMACSQGKLAAAKQLVAAAPRTLDFLEACPVVPGRRNALCNVARLEGRTARHAVKATLAVAKTDEARRMLACSSDMGQCTPLMEAARLPERLPALEALLACSVVRESLPLTSAFGRTAHWFAATNGNVEGLCLLLRGSATPTVSLELAQQVAQAVCRRLDGTPQELLLCSLHVDPRDLVTYWKTACSAAGKAENHPCVVLCSSELRRLRTSGGTRLGESDLAFLRRVSKDAAPASLFGWVDSLQEVMQASEQYSLGDTARLQAQLRSSEGLPSLLWELGPCSCQLNDRAVHRPVVALFPTGAKPAIYTVLVLDTAGVRVPPFNAAGHVTKDELEFALFHRPPAEKEECLGSKWKALLVHSSVGKPDVDVRPLPVPDLVAAHTWFLNRQCAEEVEAVSRLTLGC